MPVMSASYPVDAGPRTVAGILRDTDFAAAALARAGHSFASPRRILIPGDRVRIGVRVGRVRLPVVTIVTAADVEGFRSARPGLVRHVVRLSGGPAPAPGGSIGPGRADQAAGCGDSATRVDDEIRWTLPAARAAVAALLAARAAELRERVAAAAGASIVVATALVRDGRVLAARRARPPALAGHWELPGGRVEPGETEEAAVVRECREELGAAVVATGRIATDLPIAAGLLRVHRAELAPDSAEPAALEHAELRWVAAPELESLPWIDADRAVLPALRPLLLGTNGTFAH